MMMSARRTAASTLTLAMLLAAPAIAQVPAPTTTAQADTEETGVADIVVTAQRRAERSQDVPIAISAFSGDQLRAQGVSNALQLGQFIPNLQALNNTGLGSANAYYLRGLGNTESIATFDPPVGTYVDDIYLSRQNANNLSLFDVERVEVLRGPQGTLFGRNTTGGAINVILRQPGKEFGGYAEVGYGRFNKKLVRASVDVPVADSFSVKVSGYWQDDKGYAKNPVTGDRLNDDDGWGARIGLRGELSDTVRWNASYAHIVSESENLLNFGCDPRNPGGGAPPATRSCKGRFITTGLREGVAGLAGLGITGRKANYDLGNKTETDLITSNFEVELSPDMTLNLITGYVNLTQQFLLDFYDGRGAGPTVNNPFPTTTSFARGGFVIGNDGQAEQFTQEIKLNGSVGDGLVDYVMGAFYINETNRTDFVDTFTVAPTITLLLADRILRNKTEASAGYAQVDFNVTEQIKLTAGIRYTDEKKSFTIQDNRPGCATGAILAANCLTNANLVANGNRIPQSQRAKLWTPRFAVNFKPNNDVLVFASATRGFKSGGWNARGTSGSSFLPFGPEKVWNYEAGLKSDLFDRMVRFNLTAYYLDVKGLQTPAALIAPSGAISFITRNFADYVNKGVELELTVVPTSGLNLFTNVGYQDDKYKLPKNAPAVDAYGIASVAVQQQQCLAQLRAGQISGTTDTDPNPAVVNNAPACAAGIVAANGNIASPVRTPRWTVAIGGSYRLPLGGDLSLVPSANASWRSQQNVGTSNITYYSAPITGTNGTFPSNPFGNGTRITGGQSDAAWIVNGGLTLNGPDDRWSLTAECANCLSGTFFQSQLGYTYINAPMTWQVRARYAF